MLKDLLEQIRIEHGLDFGKTSQTDFAAASFPLHLFQLADRAQRAHASDDRVKQAEEEERKIRSVAQLAAGVGKGGMEFVFRCDASQGFQEALDHLPVAQIFGGELALVFHSRSKAEWLNLYKLQLCDELWGTGQNWPWGESTRLNSPKQLVCRTQLISDFRFPNSFSIRILARSKLMKLKLLKALIFGAAAALSTIYPGPSAMAAEIDGEASVGFIPQGPPSR
jgi:hypothetical protein